MFKFSLDVLFGNILTYIEASAACTCVTLFTDVAAALFFFLVFIQAFLCTDGQITIFKCCMNFIFLKSRKIYIQFIAFISLTYISFHNIFGMFAIKRILAAKEVISETKIIHPVIK